MKFYLFEVICFCQRNAFNICYINEAKEILDKNNGTIDIKSESQFREIIANMQNQEVEQEEIEE